MFPTSAALVLAAPQALCCALSVHAGIRAHWCQQGSKARRAEAEMDAHRQLIQGQGAGVIALALRRPYSIPVEDSQRD